MSREKALVKNTFIISLGSILPRFATLITLPILTSYLSKNEYGTFDLISTLVSLALPIILLKMDRGVFRFLIEYRSDQNRKKEVVSTTYLFIIPSAIVSVIVAFFFLQESDLVIRALICMYFFLDAIYITTQQVIRGLAGNVVYSLSAVVYAAVNMIFIVLLVSGFKYGLAGLLTAMNIAAVTALCFLVVRGKLGAYFSLRSFSKSKLKELLAYSWPLVPNGLSLWVMNLSDRLVISAFLGVEANAVYAVANKIPNLLAVIKGSFNAAWTENAALTAEEPDTGQYYSHIFDVTFCILIGAAAVLIGVTPVLFKILIQGNYTEAYYQMPLLFGAMVCSCLSSFMGGIYTACKQTKSVGMTTIGAALCNLLINVLLIRNIGLYAASASTLISYVLLVIFRIIDVQRFQRMTFKIKKCLLCVGALTVMGIVFYMNSHWLNIINLILGVLLAFCVNKKLVCFAVGRCVDKIRQKDDMKM